MPCRAVHQTKCALRCLAMCVSTDVWATWTAVTCASVRREWPASSVTSQVRNWVFPHSAHVKRNALSVDQALSWHRQLCDWGVSPLTVLWKETISIASILYNIIKSCDGLTIICDCMLKKNKIKGKRCICVCVCVGGILFDSFEV